MAEHSGGWMRRAVTAGALAALAAAGLVTAGTPATADQPSVTVSVSSPTVVPGDTVTVTETVTDVIGSSILQPTAELLSTPDPLTGFTTLTGCAAGPGGTCDTVADPDGNPIGYRAVFGSALDGGTSATATFTLTVDADADSATETLVGDFVATNFGSGPVAGPTLTIDARADVAVGMTGKPVRNGLGLALSFTVTATDLGPAPVRSAQLTATVPTGLRVAGTSSCTATGGGALCHIGAVVPGGHGTATFAVPVGLLDIGIPFRFTVSRTDSTPTDPSPANDDAAVTCTVVSVLLARCSPS